MVVAGSKKPTQQTLGSSAAQVAQQLRGGTKRSKQQSAHRGRSRQPRRGKTARDTVTNDRPHLPPASSDAASDRRTAPNHERRQTSTYGANSHTKPAVGKEAEERRSAERESKRAGSQIQTHCLWENRGKYKQVECCASQNVRPG